MNLGKRMRLALALLAGAGLNAAGQAAAQYIEDPGTALSRHLRDLSDDPRDAGSLIGAGQAALALGDPQAAATFFARAEEIAPRDSRAKAGLGASFTQLHQPTVALKFFADAVRAGAAERDIAADRGLAHDMIGDSRQAQRDYRLALQARENDEVRRRLALSLAISGDRAGAEAALDVQLRRQDRAAWRTRAFVMALVGDSGGASSAAAAVMAPAQANAMRPFFARLASLNPAQKAMAVHFGEFPADGQTTQMAQTFDTAPPPPASALVADRNRGTLLPQAGTAHVAPPARAPIAAADTPRRRLGESRRAERAESGGGRIGPGMRPDLRARRTIARAQPTLPGTGQTRQFASTAQVARPADPQPIQRQSVTAAPPPAAPARTSIAPPAPQRDVAATAPSSEPVRNVVSTTSSAALPPVGVVASGPVSLLPSPTAAERTAVAPRPIGPPTGERGDILPRPIGAGPGFAGLAATIAGLGDASPPTRPTRTVVATATPRATAGAVSPPAQPVEKPVAPVVAKQPPKKVAPAKPKAPSRVWVQIASGANKAMLPREFARAKEKAPKLFASRSAWTAPSNATNRLLVGPFKSRSEAQAFVNDLAGESLQAFSWTSEDGQEIEKLPAR